MTHNLRPISGFALFVLAASSVAALVLPATAPCYAADQPRIVLHLVDPSGAPVAGVQVEMVQASPDWTPRAGGTMTRQKTNKSGQITFAFLKADDYVLHPLLESGQSTLKLSVKTRDSRRKPVPGIEDRDGAFDPTKTWVPVQVPNEADVIDVTLTVGAPPKVVQEGPADPNTVDVKDAALKRQLFGAVEQIQGDKFAEALTTVDALLEKRGEMLPEDLASVLYMRGFALFRLDRLADAEAPLQEAVKINPKFTAAFDLLSNVYIQLKRYPEAAATLRADLDQTTEAARRAPLLLNYALALREQKKDAEAIAPLEEARGIAPDDATILVQLADAYMAVGRDADAETLLGGAANLPPAEAAALQFNLGATLARTKKYEAAEQHFRKALAIDPNLAAARRYVGETLLSQGKKAEAVAELEAYLAAAPTAADAADVKAIVDALKKEAAGAAKPKKK